MMERREFSKKGSSRDGICMGPVAASTSLACLSSPVFFFLLLRLISFSPPGPPPYPALNACTVTPRLILLLPDHRKESDR